MPVFNNLSDGCLVDRISYVSRPESVRSTSGV